MSSSENICCGDVETLGGRTRALSGSEFRNQKVCILLNCKSGAVGVISLGLGEKGIQNSIGSTKR
jgi:hypothetical protein